MAIDRARRDAMLQAAAATWGEEAAQTLAEHLEPDGERLASQGDIRGVVAAMNAMDARIEQRFTRLESRFDNLEDRFDLKLDKASAELTVVFERGIAAAVNHQTKTLVFSQLGALIVFAGIVIGVN